MTKPMEPKPIEMLVGGEIIAATEYMGVLIKMPDGRRYRVEFDVHERFFALETELETL